MTSVAVESIDQSSTVELSPLASGTNLLMAAMIYVCTNPGRAQGLGVITEPLLVDFDLSRTALGQINFWATMVVAALSFSFGTLLDGLGSYRAAWMLTALTATATALTAMAGRPWSLFAAITLARLFGQGILAVAASGLLGKSFRPARAPMAAAVYLMLTAVFYAGIIQWVRVGTVDLDWSWREVWLVIAAMMGFVAFLSAVFTVEPTIPPPDRAAMRATNRGDYTVWQAIRHPLFIVFGLYCLIFGTAVKGIDIFMESLLKDRGLGKDVFFDSLMIGVLSLIAFKFAIAWLCSRW